MDKAKIKVIIILILAFTNLFLLFIVVSNSLDSRKSLTARNEALVEVLANRSITLSESVELVDLVPTEIMLVRNLSTEQKMPNSLIGKTTVTDKGGNIYHYEGVSGSATFRGTGDFQVEFDANTISIGSDPVKTSVSVLRKMGIDCVADGASVSTEGINTIVTLSCNYRGDSVFNMSVTCLYKNEYLSTIEGRRPLDDVESKTTPETYPDVATILMSFLNYLDANGEVCTQIMALDLGYFAISKDVSSYSLLPVWRVSTDIGTYYFNALTGDAVQLDG